MNPLEYAWVILKNSNVRQTEVGCPKCRAAGIHYGLLKRIDTGAFFCPHCGWASDEPHMNFDAQSIDDRSDEPSRGAGSWNTTEEGVEY